MRAATRFLCRLFGLYCLIMACAMALHREPFLATIGALVHEPPLLFILGILMTLGGLALILVHNHWRGGSYAVIVTVLAWISLLKGILFLFIEPSNAPGFYLDTLRYARMFYVYAGISAAIGLYLCYGGFRRQP